MRRREPDEEALVEIFREQDSTITDDDVAALAAFVQVADSRSAAAPSAPTVLSVVEPVRRRPSRWLTPVLVAATVVLALVAILVTTRGASPNAATPNRPAPSSSVAPSSVAPSTSATAETGSGPVEVVPAPIEVTPADGAVDVAPNAPVSITAPSFQLQDDVRLTADDGTVVAGELDPGRETWTATGRLAYGTTYTLSGSAEVTPEGPGGSRTLVVFDHSFSTLAPAAVTGATINIPEGDVVGIAAPIIVTFERPVADKAAAEAALIVTTSQGAALQGSWAWMQDEDFEGTGVQSQAHWRPTVSPVVGDIPYWPAGTEVTVDLDLVGVDLGEGYWGRSDEQRSFTVRPDARVMKADYSAFHLIVMVDGQVTKNYPVSYGEESVPGRLLTNGVHVVTAKYPEYKMCHESFGYCDDVQPWAVRINNNGEFIHENPAVDSTLGRANVTHGAINMGSPDAEEFYRESLYGDPVEITNAPGPAMTETDALYDWIYSPAEWQALSALS